MGDHIIIDKADLQAAEREYHTRGWRHGALAGLLLGCYLGSMLALVVFHLGMPR
jgi:hypothetical protein